MCQQLRVPRAQQLAANLPPASQTSSIAASSAVQHSTAPDYQQQRQLIIIEATGLKFKVCSEMKMFGYSSHD